jgi:hypothetical protein
VIDVLVACGRRVGAERLLVARHRARHAQARIGVDVVGSDESFRELVEDVVVLGQELAGDVERDAVGTVLANAIGKPVREHVERALPLRAPRLVPLGVAHERMRQSRGERLRRGGEMQRSALAAELPEVGRMIGIAADPGDAPVRVLDHDATATPQYGQVERVSVIERRTRRHARSQPGKPRVQPLIRRDRFARRKLDRPVVQRARHAIAEHDALRQRPALVRTAVEDREDAVVGGTEHRYIAVGMTRTLDDARAENGNVGERANRPHFRTSCNRHGHSTHTFPPKRRRAPLPPKGRSPWGGPAALMPATPRTGGCRCAPCSSRAMDRARRPA